MATTHNFCIEQGATFQRDFTYKDSDGDPIDLTGSEVRLQCRRKVTDTSTLIDISTATSGITFTDASMGQFQILLPATMTAMLSFKVGVYDMEVEFPSGEVIRLIQGTITLLPEVTR